MNKEKINRSPLFYVGDKYKLIGEIRQYFPSVIHRFFEPFVGGGSVFLNAKAKEYFLNDIDKNIIDIHRFLCSYANNPDDFFNLIFSIIDKYGLSCSYRQDVVPQEIKKQYKKTYYSHFNKTSYNNLKNYYNNSTNKDIAELYILLIYGFNRMLRFNNSGKFNLPVGNVDFNTNVHNALCDYFKINAENTINWSAFDFKNFLNRNDWTHYDFIYLDPPYLITDSEYNKLWNDKAEQDLLVILDSLNEKNVRFAISNVINYKGKENTIFSNWAKKYNTYNIKSNYINYHDNSIKNFTEVLVTNYDKENAFTI